MIMCSKNSLMYVCGYLEGMSKVVYSILLEFAVCWHKLWVGEQLLRCHSSSRCCNIWRPLCSCIIWQGRAEGTETISQWSISMTSAVSGARKLLRELCALFYWICAVFNVKELEAFTFFSEQTYTYMPINSLCVVVLLLCVVQSKVIDNINFRNFLELVPEVRELIHDFYARCWSNVSLSSHECCLLVCMTYLWLCHCSFVFLEVHKQSVVGELKSQILLISVWRVKILFWPVTYYWQPACIWCCNL